MTPRTFSTIAPIASPADEPIASRRFDATDRMFGFGLCETLSGWMTEGRGVHLVNVVETANGVLVGLLQHTHDARCPRFRMFTASDTAHARKLIAQVVGEEGNIGLCLGVDRSESAVLGATQGRLTTRRSREALRAFRADALGRDDIFEPEIVGDLYEDAVSLGSLCSPVAVELMMADLMSLALCGPDGRRRH